MPLSVKGLAFGENTGIFPVVQGVMKSLETSECCFVYDEPGSFIKRQGPSSSSAMFSDHDFGVSAFQCKALSRPERGYVSCLPAASGSFQKGSSCEFFCEQGFVLKGSKKLQCGPTGEWDSEEPTCEGTVFVFILTQKPWEGWRRDYVRNLPLPQTNF